MPVKGPSDGCFSKQLKGDNGFTKVSSIIGAGYRAGIGDVVLVGQGNIGGRDTRLEPVRKDPGNGQLRHPMGAIGAGVLGSIVKAGNGIIRSSAVQSYLPFLVAGEVAPGVLPDKTWIGPRKFLPFFYDG